MSAWAAWSTDGVGGAGGLGTPADPSADWCMLMAGTTAPCTTCLTVGLSDRDKPVGLKAVGESDLPSLAGAATGWPTQGEPGGL